MSSEQAKELRRQGIAAAKAGQKDQARQLLQQSLRLEPNSEAGWLWLVSVARDQRERLFCLNKLLDINPNNEMALQSLQQLGLTREQLRQSQQAPGQPAQTSTPPPTLGRSTPPPDAQPAAPTPSTQAPGVPVADPQKIAQAQAEAEQMVREYLGAPRSYPGVTWVRKTGRRAGERDAMVLRLYIGAGVAVALIGLFIVGALVVLNNPELRGIVFAPTWTISPTPAPPSNTPTPTPGVTPTPSPTPELTYTPSPTVPPEIPNGAQSLAPTLIYPPVQEKGIRDSIALLDGGQFDVAIPTLNVEITRVASSFDPNPYYYSALAYIQKGDLDAASEVLNDAEKRLPERPNDNFKPLIDAGFAYLDLKLAQKALDDNNRTEANSQLSNVKDRAEAAIKGDSRLELPYLALAQRYTLNRDYDLAVSVLDQGLSVPDLASDVNLIVQKGEVYFQQKEYDLASYQAFLALYINPAVEQAHLLQIHTALAQDNPGLAVLNAQAYLFYYPGSVEGYKLLGEAREAEGNFDLALEAYNQALAGGDNADILVARAALYNRQRRFEQARVDLSTAFTITKDPAIQAQRMLAAYNAGNTATAQSDAEALLGKGVIPDSQIQLIQARILIDEAKPADKKDFTDALGLLTTIGNNLPDELQPVANEYRARAQYNLEDYTDALKLVNQALTVGETGSRYYLRGLILEAQGDTASALKDYDWVLTLSSVYPYPFLPDARNRFEALQAPTP
ncbi:MAG: tetratricopeptide repeat protein [Chloroflexota bacterium]